MFKIVIFNSNKYNVSNYPVTIEGCAWRHNFIHNLGGVTKRGLEFCQNPNSLPLTLVNGIGTAGLLALAKTAVPGYRVLAKAKLVYSIISVD